MQIAEQGGRPPWLQLLVGNFVVMGQPISESEFVEIWSDSASKAGFRAARPKKHERNDTWDRVSSEVSSILEPVKRALAENGAEPDAICLAPAQAVLVTTGEAADIPCLRVPVNQVNAWWGGEANWTRPASGTSFFVGGLFPTGDS